jgi:hypothetical protein
MIIVKENELFNMTKVYRFTFADGYFCICRGMDRVEMSHEVAKHGKLISKTLEGRY